jgi:hypothetical protein
MCLKIIDVQKVQDHHTNYENTVVAGAGDSPANFFSQNQCWGIRSGRHSAEPIVVIRYLREYESIFETASAYEPGVLFAENFVTLPLYAFKIIMKKQNFWSPLFKQRLFELFSEVGSGSSQNRPDPPTLYKTAGF